MIQSIRSNREEFKAVEFQPGLNVILAQRTAEASERDSRNATGKSSLLEILHFCLGSDMGRSPLSHEALRGWAFSMDMEVRTGEITATRNTERAGRVLLSGATRDWPITPRTDEDTGDRFVTVDEWKRLLLWLMFDLPVEVGEETYSPTSRVLLSYFARRTRDAFSDPFTSFRNQPGWSKQIHTALLLDLDWRYPQRAELLRKREESLRQARAAVEAWREAAREAAPRDFVPEEATQGALEATRITLEARVRDFAEQLASFKVHPQYSQYEAEASQLTMQIHDLVNANVTDREFIEFYEESLVAEEPAAPQALAAMYEEARIHFPDQVNRRLDEVEAFYEALVENRRRYLTAEMQRLSREIEAREAEIESLSSRRASVLAFLQEHGALEEYLRLQEAHQQTVEHLARVEAQLAELRRFEDESARLRIEREELFRDARNDFEDRRPIWTLAVELFAANTSELYERPGRLVLDVTNSGGLALNIEMERAASQGIQEMMVFCYDIMLAQMWAARPVKPSFVFHDSTIFDGVDERQVSRALQLAARSGNEQGYQYICSLNSDTVPWSEFPPGFDLNEHVVLELTDTETGGLFGMRFG